MKRSYLPIIFLLLSNLWPLLGVLFYGWSINSIIFYYWFENVVVGFYAVLKLWRAEGAYPVIIETKGKRGNSSQTFNNRYSLIAFFIFHFGVFTAVHGYFVSKTFGFPSNLSTAISIAALSLLVSHGVSFAQHFIRNREYERVPQKILFYQPYRGLIIIHFSILLGGGIHNLFFASNLSVLVLILVLTAVVDISTHLREHKRFKGDA